jgi:fused signal recognition particle receptor
VIARFDETAPHETLLVLDGGSGQNAIAQARQFGEAVDVSGVAITKLDGTAKGGVAFAVVAETGLPIRFVGVGEKPEDLRPFDAEAFVDALLGTGPAEPGTGTEHG